MPDETHDTTPPYGTLCQYTMRGSKTVRRGHALVSINKWSRSCPNRATGKVKRRWVCAAHGGPKR